MRGLPGTRRLARPGEVGADDVQRRQPVRQRAAPRGPRRNEVKATRPILEGTGASAGRERASSARADFLELGCFEPHAILRLLLALEVDDRTGLVGTVSGRRPFPPEDAARHAAPIQGLRAAARRGVRGRLRQRGRSFAQPLNQLRSHWSSAWCGASGDLGEVVGVNGPIGPSCSSCRSCSSDAALKWVSGTVVALCVCLIATVLGVVDTVATGSGEAVRGVAIVRTGVGPTRRVSPGFGCSLAYRTVETAAVSHGRASLALVPARPPSGPGVHGRILAA
jgi:hypothetical protein